MAIPARRQNVQISDKSKVGHAGLLHQRYLRAVDDQNASSRELVELMQSSMQNVQTIYSQSFQRFKDSLEKPQRVCPFKSGLFKTQDCRLIVGLSTASPSETGLTLHHTYGVPYIPGSALKGLAAHYCDTTRGATETFARGGEAYQTLFGDSNTSGALVFHDGWIDPTQLKNCLQPDIMTVHHQDYYMGNDKAPTDFDEPNPIPFVSVTGSFWISVSCPFADPTDEKSQQWANLGFTILKEALKEWGVGGKTSSGYGRLLLN